MRLSAEEHHVHQRHILSQTRRVMAAAEALRDRKEMEEMALLRHAENHGLDLTRLDPETAFKVAKSARETLLAEEQVALIKVREAEVKLATLRDAVEEAHARVQDATVQLSKLNNTLIAKGVSLKFFQLFQSPSSSPSSYDHLNSLPDLLQHPDLLLTRQEILGHSPSPSGSVVSEED